MGTLELMQQKIDRLCQEVEELKKLTGTTVYHDPKEVMTVKQICRELNISRSTFNRNYATLPFLTRTKTGGQYRCLRGDFDKFLKQKFGNGKA